MTSIQSFSLYTAKARLEKPIADATHTLTEISFIVVRIRLTGGVVGESYLLSFQYSPQAIIGALKDQGVHILGEEVWNTVKVSRSLDAANEYFDIQDSFDIRERSAKIEAKGLDLNPTITSDIITGVEIDDYDNFIAELKVEGSSQAQRMSLHDIERLYNLYCFKIIDEQTDERTRYAPARSWGSLKSALNVWFGNNTQLDRADYYKVIIKDLMSKNSVLLEVIRKALWDYRPVRTKEVAKRAEHNRERSVAEIEVPVANDRFTDLCEELDVKRNVYDHFYIGKDYKGKKNEEAFLRFIDNNEDVEWWHKNGDHGSLYFAVPYMDGEIEKLFYPDWFIKTKDKVWVVDTKSGETVDGAGSRAEGLKTWLTERHGFDGGIVIPAELGNWRIFVGSEYDASDSSQWKTFRP